MHRIADHFFYSFMPGTSVGWCVYGLLFGSSNALALAAIMLAVLIMYYFIGYRNGSEADTARINRR